MKRMGNYSLALLCIVVAGCASPMATRLSTHGAGLTPAASLAILEAEPDGAPVDTALDILMKKSLIARGYSMSPDSAFILNMAFGIRPGGIGVFGTPTAAPLSSTQKKSGLGKCKVHVHRLTLSVLERASGNPLYQGMAEETHCNALAANSLPHLIEALTVDLAKPGGDRVVTRKKLR
jgi:hypothetical protein